MTVRNNRLTITTYVSWWDIAPRANICDLNMQLNTNLSAIYNLKDYI